MRDMLHFLLATNTSRASRRFEQLMSHELQLPAMLFSQKIIQHNTFHSGCPVC